MVASSGAGVTVAEPSMVGGMALSAHGMMMASNGAGNFASQKGRVNEGLFFGSGSYLDGQKFNLLKDYVQPYQYR